MSRGQDDGKKQEIYVDKRLAGVEPRKAARKAGYSDRTHIHQIERAGGPVDIKLREAMLERGLDERFLSKEYVTGIKASKKDGARDKDLNAHAQYLKQLGFLMGYGKREPAVAVQINNQQSSGVPQVNDPRRIEELIQQVTILLEGIKDEFGDRVSAGVCEGSIGDKDTTTLDGVGGTTTFTQETGGGSK